MSYTVAIYGKNKKLVDVLIRLCKEHQLEIVGTANISDDFLKIFETYFPNIVLFYINKVTSTIDFKLADKITHNNIITKVVFITESCQDYKKAYKIFGYDCIEKQFLSVRLPRTLNRIKKEIDLIKRPQ